MPNYEVRDFPRASLLTEDLGAWQQTAYGVSYGPVIGLSWMFGHGPGSLQYIEPLPELLELSQNAPIFSGLLSGLYLRVHRFLDILPGELTAAH